MRCNHKNLLRINFIAQSRDQLEVKQELRLVAKEKKTSATVERFAEQIQDRSAVFSLGASQGIRTPDCSEIIASGCFFSKKNLHYQQNFFAPKNLTIFREPNNQRSGLN